MGLTAEAPTLTRTSPIFGTGFGSSPKRMTSGVPVVSMKAAFMTLRLLWGHDYRNELKKPQAQPLAGSSSIIMRIGDAMRKCLSLLSLPHRRPRGTRYEQPDHTDRIRH